MLKTNPDSETWVTLVIGAGVFILGLHGVISGRAESHGYGEVAFGTLFVAAAFATGRLKALLFGAAALAIVSAGILL